MINYLTGLWNEIQSMLNVRYPNWKTERLMMGSGLAEKFSVKQIVRDFFVA
jgi:hypothetical protein